MLTDELPAEVVVDDSIVVVGSGVVLDGQREEAELALLAVSVAMVVEVAELVSVFVPQPLVELSNFSLATSDSWWRVVELGW